jgi:hypothetical protein
MFQSTMKYFITLGLFGAFKCSNFIVKGIYNNPLVHFSHFAVRKLFNFFLINKIYVSTFELAI